MESVPAFIGELALHVGVECRTQTVLSMLLEYMPEEHEAHAELMVDDPCT